jgi:hypothetical protein
MTCKPYDIPKALIWEAWLHARASQGAAGIEKSGGVQILVIPTVADRIAQTAVKMWLEPQLDPLFRDDSLGYRPGNRRWRRSPLPDAAAGPRLGCRV